MRKVFGKGVCLIAVLGLAVFVGGCAHTPETRIAKNPEFFAGLSAEDQETIRAGEVQIGFTPEMVLLALGEPDRRVTRRTREGSRVSWIYQGRFVTTETVRVRDQFGAFRPVYPTLYLDRTVEHYYTKARLVFEDGELVSIEQAER